MITPPTMRRFADYSEMRPRNWSEKRSTDKSALKKTDNTAEEIPTLAQQHFQ